jgi:hypothetical protein
MNNILTHKDFVRKSYSNYDNVNEGFLSKMVLALSLTFASLFVSPNAAQAANSPIYPTEFKIMHDDYDDIMQNLRGLTEHIKDPSLVSLLDEMDQLHDDLDGMYGNNFNIRWNVIKVKLVKVIERYGIYNYNIEQISKHMTSKDFPRASVDAQYIKAEMNKIAGKFNVTGWERLSAGDVATIVVLGVVGLALALFLGFVVYNVVGDRVQDWRWRRQERRRRALHPPAPVHHAPVHHHPVHHDVPPLFPIGSRLTYNKPESHRDGQHGTLLEVREDGKYVLRLDDGTRFAASLKYLRLAQDPAIANKHKKDDPYGEEVWEN